MAKIIAPDDIKEIANIIATSAAEELQKNKPQLLLKSAGLSLHTFNTSTDAEQTKMLAKSFDICKATFAAQFEKEIADDPVEFFVNHTGLFTMAELELEEYYTEE